MHLYRVENFDHMGTSFKKLGWLLLIFDYYSKFHIGRHFFLAPAWRVTMWAWRVNGDRHLFDWMIFTSNVRKIRGSLSGDNVRLTLSQWKTRWYPQSREGDVSTHHVHYLRKVPTVKKFAVLAICLLN